jgi:hypothetical protein
MPDVGFDDVLVQGQAPRFGALPLPAIVPARTEAAEFVGADVERIEVQAVERPSAVREPVALLEVDWIEGTRTKSRLTTEEVDDPGVRRSAKLAAPRSDEGVIGVTNDFALGE